MGSTHRLIQPWHFFRNFGKRWDFFRNRVIQLRVILGKLPRKQNNNHYFKKDNSSVVCSVTALGQTETFLFYFLYQMAQVGKEEILDSCILFFDMRVLL